MKKIAIPVIDDKLCENFEDALHLHIYDVENRKIIKQTLEKMPSDTQASILEYLKNLKVTDLIAGDIDRETAVLLSRNNINVFYGAKSIAADEIVNYFLNTFLDLENNHHTCGGHNHGHGCCHGHGHDHGHHHGHNHDGEHDCCHGHNHDHQHGHGHGHGKGHGHNHDGGHDCCHGHDHEHNHE